jgi:hypothetical protein
MFEVYNGSGLKLDITMRLFHLIVMNIQYYSKLAFGRLNVAL